jgi:hypothetical protein
MCRCQSLLLIDLLWTLIHARLGPSSWYLLPNVQAWTGHVRATYHRVGYTGLGLWLWLLWVKVLIHLRSRERHHAVGSPCLIRVLYILRQYRTELLLGDLEQLCFYLRFEVRRHHAHTNMLSQWLVG